MRARRCVIRCLVQKRFLIAGGAAPEVEVATQLNRWAKTLVVRARGCMGCLWVSACPALF
jgi:hypothetical protein